MESEYGKAIKAQLTEKKNKIEAKFQADKKRLETLKESIQAKLSTYTPKQREEKTREFQKKYEALQKYARESEESLMKEQESETTKLLSLFEKLIADYGQRLRHHRRQEEHHLRR